MIRKSSVIIIFLGFISIFFSCKKEDLDFGLNILQEEDLIGAYADSNSVSISFKTVYEDTLRSSKITYMLGSCNQSTVGKTRADFVSRFYFKELSVNLKKCDLDSICLEMNERPQYTGDTLVNQTFKIYELTETMTVEDCQAYYEQLQIPTQLLASAHLIGQKDYIPRTDTISKFSFKFDNIEAQNLYDRVSSVYYMDSAIQTVDSLMLKKFKGLYVTTDFQNAAIVNYAPQLCLYVHDADSSYKVVLLPSITPYYSTSSLDSSHIYLQALNMFHHEYTSEITNMINVANADVSYVQGFMGLKSLVSFTGLDAWQDSVVVFNSVKLHVPFYEEQQVTHAPFTLPKLQIYNPSGTQILSIEASNPDSLEYVFNLNGFMTYVNNHTIPASQYSCQIVFSENNVFGNILALDATQTDRLKLKIVYSK